MAKGIMGTGRGFGLLGRRLGGILVKNKLHRHSVRKPYQLHKIELMWGHCCLLAHIALVEIAA